MLGLLWSLGKKASLIRNSPPVKASPKHPFRIVNCHIMGEGVSPRSSFKLLEGGGGVLPLLLTSLSAWNMQVH